MSKNCRKFPLLNHCYYIQSCVIDPNINNCENICNINGSIIAFLSFDCADKQTDTYYVYYYLITHVNPPININGVANRVDGDDKNINCIFNDGTVFNIKFSSDKYDLGKIQIISPIITGDFCVIKSDLYSQFYTNNN